MKSSTVLGPRTNRALSYNMEHGSTPERNQFLAALPRDSYERLLPHLEARMMHVRDVLWEPNEPIERVHFPRSFVGSILIPLQSETTSVEAATVGREGFMGTPIVLGVNSSSSLAIAQVEGDTAHVASATIRALVRKDAVLLEHCLRYVHVLQEQTAQSVACNTRHSLEERCARWLLMTHDRVGRDSFGLLQTFLAAMLGVHRPRVTVAAGMLQQAGLISYQRGVITIVNRAGLEAASCECYATVLASHERALEAA